MEKFSFANFDHMPLQRCIELKFAKIWYAIDSMVWKRELLFKNCNFGCVDVRGRRLEQLVP